MKEISLKARAKINISLDILNRRDNGYHDVEMIMQTVELHDKITMKCIKGNKILIKTNLPYLPVDERNLVYKIIQFMKNQYSLKTGVFVNLYKKIPVAAGLAGGSSDAAQAIMGMNQLFELDLTLNEMLEIGQRFGSDIPYCIIQGTALATGLGESITYLDPMPEFYVVIVKPNFSMSTALVYKNFDLKDVVEHPDTLKIIKAIENQDKKTICENLVNVLETVTPNIHPEINAIKVRMSKLGAEGVLMSGSGPSVYGLFNDEQEAKSAAVSFRADHNIQFAYHTSIYNRRKG